MSGGCEGTFTWHRVQIICTFKRHWSLRPTNGVATAAGCVRVRARVGVRVRARVGVKVGSEHGFGTLREECTIRDIQHVAMVHMSKSINHGIWCRNLAPTPRQRTWRRHQGSYRLRVFRTAGVASMRVVCHPPSTKLQSTVLHPH